MFNFIVETIDTILNVEIITALLTTVTVGLSTWAAISAKKSADAAQSQFNLSKEDSKMSKQPLLIPIESDYQAMSFNIDDTLDGENKIVNDFGDLVIELTNVSNTNAFNLVSYLEPTNLENYLDFVSKNDLEEIWLGSYSIRKNDRLSPNKISYSEIELRSKSDDSKQYFSLFKARNRAHPKMTISKDELMNVTVNSYAQIILRDYINRKLNQIFDSQTPLVDPNLVIKSRYKTLEQLRTNKYTVTTYKVVLHQMSSSSNKGIFFRLMYEFESEIIIDG